MSNLSERFLDPISRSRLQAVWCGLHRDRALPKDLSDYELAIQTRTGMTQAAKTGKRSVKSIAAVDRDHDPVDMDDTENPDHGICLCDCSRCVSGDCSRCTDPSCSDPACTPMHADDRLEEEGEEATDDSDEDSDRRRKDEDSDDEDE